MSATIIRKARKALRNARASAREGNAWFARLWLAEAWKHYPVSRQQTEAINRLLEKATEGKGTPFLNTTRQLLKGEP